MYTTQFQGPIMAATSGQISAETEATQTLIALEL